MKKNLVINFSGGKDSSAMLAYLVEEYPEARKWVIMADTGWEHTDAIPWSRQIVGMFGLDLIVVRNPNKDFFGMVRHRQMFPSPAYRQCTSDLKRAPVAKWIRNQFKEGETVYNCLGLRAEESPARAKLDPLKENKRLTNTRRTVIDYLPIHDWSTEQVLSYLKERDIPLHPVYNYLKRFSCRVCIFMSDADLRAVRENDPEAFQTIADLEEEIGFTLRPEGTVIELAQGMNDSWTQGCFF